MEMINNGNNNYYVGGEGERRPKTTIVCTLGPASRSVEMFEKLLCTGMNVTIFNFSHGSHEYHQQTLDNLRHAMKNTIILCAVMLDTKQFEICLANKNCESCLYCETYLSDRARGQAQEASF